MLGPVVMASAQKAGSLNQIKPFYEFSPEVRTLPRHQEQLDISVTQHKNTSITHVIGSINNLQNIRKLIEVHEK